MSAWEKFKNFFTGHNSNSERQQVIVVARDNNVPNQKPRIDKMSDFSNVLQEKNIAVGVEAGSKEEILKYLAEFSNKLDPKLDIETIYGKYLVREKECPTDLGSDVAIPHAQDASISKLTMIVLKLNKEVKWNKHEKVKTVISFLIPDPETDYQHVPYMSTVARLLLQKDFSKSLQKATTAEEINKLFKK